MFVDELKELTDKVSRLIKRQKNGIFMLYKFKVSQKPPKEMTAAQINNELDKLDKVIYKINSLMIELGRGWERPAKTRKKYGEDWLSTQYCDVVDRFASLYSEIELRFGSRVYRLPKGRRGFGPRKWHKN